MDLSNDLPFFVSIPHSGEKLPAEVTWLSQLPEPTLMRDVDRFVDRLYERAIADLKIPCVLTEWHRYVVDLNRTTDQVDQSSVAGSENPVGTHPKGLHWSVTTLQEPLITTPMPQELHKKLVELYYKPFHDSVQDMGRQFLKKESRVFHLDLHSMPSLGTQMHPDPGESRAQVVVSDFHGKSADGDFKDIVMRAYQDAGFQVAYNWPYVGGGITQMYGRPELGHETIQIELNRALYMDEVTKQLDVAKLEGIQAQLSDALTRVREGISGMANG